VTDAWHPQVNGLVTAYENLSREIDSAGCRVEIVSPAGFRTFPCPSYPEIALAIRPYAQLAKRFAELKPDCIHIATEGPLGHAARRYCLKHKLQFTTALHTRFPEYIRMRTLLPLSWGYAYLRHFHRPARCTIVPTQSQKRHLLDYGFEHVEVCRHGVNTDVFRPDEKMPLDLPRPIMMYMGRVAVEKNINAFLELDLPGSYCVVGNGPDLRSLKKKYPRAHFYGYRFNGELAAFLAAADVLVFPSRTDTFGLVMLEAMACGTPVAAYPVTGPGDIVENGATGCLHGDLRQAIEGALTIPRANCLAYARSQSWKESARRFMQLLVAVR
jgi:glycosyltransferase involved in cell wall biosynthesis